MSRKGNLKKVESVGHTVIVRTYCSDQSVFDQSVFDHVCVCVQLKREELMKVPPEEMFKSETDKYSQFDEQVLTIKQCHVMVM